MQTRRMPMTCARRLSDASEYVKSHARRMPCMQLREGGELHLAEVFVSPYGEMLDLYDLSWAHSPPSCALPSHANPDVC